MDSIHSTHNPRFSHWPSKEVGAEVGPCFPFFKSLAEDSKSLSLEPVGPWGSHIAGQSHFLGVWALRSGYIYITVHRCSQLMIVKIPLLYPFTQPYPVGAVTELTPPASRPMAQGAPWWTMSWTPGPAPRYLTAPRLWTQLDVLPNNCDKRNGPQQSPVLEGLWRPPNGRSRYGF
jgi:hypothetical protein